MDKEQVIFLAASIIILKQDACFRNITNTQGKKDFKEAFTNCHQLLSELYGTFHDTPQKK